MYQSLSWAPLPQPFFPKRRFASLDRYAATAMAGALEFVVFISFVGSCIGLIAEFT